mmetsp:Transcript_20144/g.29769  ORF Transcript_20144/g.29769 Transcript_20144/m.29769 type:complete len:274 (-) Transcript_20144:736-1557(-)
MCTKDVAVVREVFQQHFLRVRFHAQNFDDELPFEIFYRNAFHDLLKRQNTDRKQNHIQSTKKILLLVNREKFRPHFSSSDGLISSSERSDNVTFGKLFADELPKLSKPDDSNLKLVALKIFLCTLQCRSFQTDVDKGKRFELTFFKVVERVFQRADHEPLAWVRTQNSHERRDLPQIRECSLGRLVVFSGQEVKVKAVLEFRDVFRLILRNILDFSEVLQQLGGGGARLYLCQVDVAQCEAGEGFVKCPRFVGKGKDHCGFGRNVWQQVNGNG